MCINSNMTLKILKVIQEWQRLGLLHPIEHRVPLTRYRGDCKAQCLKVNGDIENPTVTACSDMMKIEASPRHKTLTLDAEAAYLLTGGFGGLGMALVYWLVEHGARTLVIISWSATQTKESRKFITEIASLGCTIIPVKGKVDVREDVEETIAKVGRPIKGVVHMAMVLRVSLIFLKESALHSSSLTGLSSHEYELFGLESRE